MKTINEWLQEKGIEELSSDYGMTTEQDDEILMSQMEQLVTRIEGLCHGMSEEKKSALMDQFMRQIEERVLGL